MSERLLICFLVPFIGLFLFSEELLYKPNLTAPLLPEEVLKRCGYRYRLHQQNIKYESKCVDRSDEMMAFKPHIEVMDTNQTHQPSNRVVGGRKAYYREAPWAVHFTAPKYYKYANGTGPVGDYYFIGGKFAYMQRKCTGSLVSHRHIIYASHCIQRDLIPYQEIHLGSNRWWKGPLQRTLVANTQIFNEFPNSFHGIGFPPGFYHDIAIAVLSEPINFTYWDSPEVNPYDKHYLINPICLPQTEVRPQMSELEFNVSNEFQNASFFGFGLIHGNYGPWFLRRANFPVNYEEPNRQMLTGPEDQEERICFGDSGGGLLQYFEENEGRAVLIGVAAKLTNRWKNKTLRCILEQVGKGGFTNVAKHMDFLWDVIRRYP